MDKEGGGFNTFMLLRIIQYILTLIALMTLIFLFNIFRRKDYIKS